MLNKISSSQINSVNVKSTPGNRLTGTVQENKNVFDKLPELVASAFNALVDALQSTADGDSGADCINITTIEGATGTTVQGLLEYLKASDDLKITSEEALEKLNLKADKTVVNMSIKSVSLEENTGILTFTRQDGSTFQIDTMLEKVVVNFSYDADQQAIIFTAADGTQSIVSISDFVTIYEFLDSDQIDFNISDGKVSATIKTGSITDSHLNPSLLHTVNQYKSEAQTAATNARASELNAADYASKALQSANAANNSAGLAEDSAESASSNAASAEEDAQRAEEARLGAEKARDEAQEIVGGDYVTNTAFNAHTNNNEIHITATERTAWNNKVDKVNGKGLSSNDYTNDDKAKVQNVKIPVVITGTLSTGQTTLTLSDSAITTDSVIDIYTDHWGVSPSDVTVETGQINMTFSSLDYELNVRAEVR